MPGLWRNTKVWCMWCIKYNNQAVLIYETSMFHKVSIWHCIFFLSSVQKKISDGSQMQLLINCSKKKNLNLFYSSLFGSSCHKWAGLGALRTFGSWFNSFWGSTLSKALYFPSIQFNNLTPESLCSPQSNNNNKSNQNTHKETHNMWHQLQS